MARTMRRFSGSVANAGALGALLLLASCGSAGAHPAACTDAAQCDDANPCTLDACRSGACVHDPGPADAVCSTGGGQVCDGAGSCVACNHDDQCLGTSPTNDCQHPACANHACAPAFTAVGTPTTANPPQVAGNCQRLECDGKGGTRQAEDDSNLPVDGKECTSDLCVGGVPSNPPVAASTACGAGLALQCNATGECGCQSNSDCVAPETCGGSGTPLVCGCTRTTCAAQGATCGSIPDGCGGTLDCADSMRDGAETDVDCGGPASTCAARCAAGSHCAAASDCQSGYCVDGVCCNTACTGACQACSAAMKGHGADGVCGAVMAGTDPANECADQGAASCGTSGVCDGSGACQRYASGTICEASTCSGGMQTSAGVCNSGGTCVPGTTSSCGAYVCGSNACQASCKTDANCASGYYCSGATACVPKLPAGSGCTANNQCTSSSCAGGVCG